MDWATTLNINPPIPLMPCFSCGKLTNPTQSVYGVGCMSCYLKQGARRAEVDEVIEKIMRFV